jgi:hypothetical protein
MNLEFIQKALYHCDREKAVIDEIGMIRRLTFQERPYIRINLKNLKSPCNKEIINAV